MKSYQQVFNQVIGTDGLEIEMKDKRQVKKKTNNFKPLFGYKIPTSFVYLFCGLFYSFYNNLLFHLFKIQVYVF